ncbi:MAG: serine/threonine protein kinase [Eubacterium sp.]|nr:serine/threonine protein kinase [Eubacterium sp.]
MNIMAIIIAMSIPSAVTGFCFWLLERRISQRDQQKESDRVRRQQETAEKERIRDEMQYLLIQSVNASLALSEATAKAVERIPDAHCNGDMKEALEYVQEVKHVQKEFLTKEGIKGIYKDIA